MGKMRKAYKILVGKLEGKRPFGRPIRRWNYNIGKYLQRNGVGRWIRLARDGIQWRALANTARGIY
jgi:hypothetical protein